MDTKFKHFQFTRSQEDECQPLSRALATSRHGQFCGAETPRPSRQSNPWAKRSPLSNASLVAYIRYTDDPWEAGRQLEKIQDYCARHGYKLEKAFEDQGKPATGLARALEALDYADGLIAVDLDRFVQHEGDKTRDLRPLVHEFLSQGSKHLITIAEGINTGSPAGQMAAIDLINQPRNHGLNMD